VRVCRSFGKDRLLKESLVFDLLLNLLNDVQGMVTADSLLAEGTAEVLCRPVIDLCCSESVEFNRARRLQAVEIACLRLRNSLL